MKHTAQFRILTIPAFAPDHGYSQRYHPPGIPLATLNLYTISLVRATTPVQPRVKCTPMRSQITPQPRHVWRDHGHHPSQAKDNSRCNLSDTTAHTQSPQRPTALQNSVVLSQYNFPNHHEGSPKAATDETTRRATAFPLSTQLSKSLRASPKAATDETTVLEMHSKNDFFFKKSFLGEIYSSSISSLSRAQISVAILTILSGSDALFVPIKILTSS